MYIIRLSNISHSEQGFSRLFLSRNASLSGYFFNANAGPSFHTVSLNEIGTSDSEGLQIISEKFVS